MLYQDSGSKLTSVEVRCGRQVSNTSVAKREAEKWPFGPSGVKTPPENADFMSCLKARPTKRETFSAASSAVEAAFDWRFTTKPGLRGEKRPGFQAPGLGICFGKPPPPP